MKLRPPSVPLITVDPYFSIWSPYDRLTDGATTHWTGERQPLTGVVFVDGAPYTFMGKQDGAPALEQTDLTVTACTSRYTFRGAGIELITAFTSPLLLDDLEIASRPVSYLKIETASVDGVQHDIRL